MTQNISVIRPLT